MFCWVRMSSPLLRSHNDCGPSHFFFKQFAELCFGLGHCPCMGAQENCLLEFGRCKIIVIIVIMIPMATEAVTCTATAHFAGPTNRPWSKIRPCRRTRFSSRCRVLLR